MSTQVLCSLLLLGTLALTISNSRQTKSVPPAPIVPITARPLIPENALFGKYFAGGLYGADKLVLSSNHRFSYEQNACQGTLNTNQGTWEMQGDVLVLHPESMPSPYLNVRYIPVIWKNYLNLVDENEMPTFGSYHLEKGQFDMWMNLCHFGKELPEGSKVKTAIPERFRHFLEHGAINVRVASVDSERIATLEGAGVSRLQPGMHLCWKEGSGSGKCELRITEIGPGFARARQVPIRSKYDSLARPGEIFTTGGSRNTPAGTGMIHQ